MLYKVDSTELHIYFIDWNLSRQQCEQKRLILVSVVVKCASYSFINESKIKIRTMQSNMCMGLKSSAIQARLASYPTTAAVIFSNLWVSVS